MRKVNKIVNVSKIFKHGGNILEFLIGIESIHLLEQHYLRYDLDYFYGLF